MITIEVDGQPVEINPASIVEFTYEVSATEVSRLDFAFEMPYIGESPFGPVTRYAITYVTLHGQEADKAVQVINGQDL